MKKLEKTLKDKRIFATLLVLLSIFGILAVLAWSTPSEIKFREIAEVYKSEGHLKHEAYLTNNTLYGSTISSIYYPKRLVKEIHLDYKFSSEHLNGEYEFNGKIIYKIKIKNNEHIMWIDDLFNESGMLNEGKFEAEKTLNISQMEGRISNVSRELGMRTLSTNVVITAKVTSKNESFTHEIALVRDPSGLLYFDNTDKVDKHPVYSERIVRNNLNILGMKIDAGVAKMAFTTPLIFVTPLFAYSSYLRVISRPKRQANTLDRFVIDGEVKSVNEVVLRSEKDLKKVFEFVDKPIIRQGDEYVIIDGGITYRYKLE